MDVTKVLYARLPGRLVDWLDQQAGQAGERRGAYVSRNRALEEILDRAIAAGIDLGGPASGPPTMLELAAQTLRAAGKDGGQ